jgi:DNA-binding NtrC family response regulator
MTLPKILIIDDKYSTNADERDNFCRKCNLLDERAVSSTAQLNQKADPYMAVASFCSGQNAGRNNYEVIEEAVQAGFDNDDSCLWSLVLLDVTFSDVIFGEQRFGLEVKRRLKARFKDLPLVLLTGLKESELNNDGGPYLSKQEINEYYLKVKLLKHGCLSQGQTEELLQLKQCNIVAESPSMIKLLLEAFIYAQTDASILILGETGTGKEVVARYIHHVSPRRKRPFVARNIAELSTEMRQSELFGIDKNRATGVAAHSGFFEQAQKGTLFLDEIGDLPLDAQQTLLRSVDNKTIVNIGSREISVDIKLLSATSKDLARLWREGLFRIDFYYRIAGESIEIPPLRERREDICRLAEHILERSQKRNRLTGISFSEGALDALKEQRFTGNVRQLKNIVERIAISKGNDEIIRRQEVLQEIEKSELEWRDKPPSHPRAILNGEPSDPIASRPGPQLLQSSGIKDITALEELLLKFEVPRSPSELFGKLTSLQHAYGQLLQRLLESALQQTKITNGDKNILPTIRLLMGTEDFKDTFRAYDKLRALSKTFSFDPPPGSELALALERAASRQSEPKSTGDSSENERPKSSGTNST